MTIVLTICSANYLAQAKTLGRSLTEHNPGFKFVIGLVDRVPRSLKPSYWEPYDLVPVEALKIANFDDLAKQYSLVELNTAVKPFYIEFLYERDPQINNIIYLDPDILVLSSLGRTVEQLRQSNIIITPHSCSFDDSEESVFFEKGMLSTGIYNLGFIATSRSDVTFAFLKWWQERLRHYCFFRPGEGLFVDQIWVNLAPIYFSGVHVEPDPGYNMCYWNHFERHVEHRQGKYFVNGNHELVFYHFSSYDPFRPEILSTRTGLRVAERPDLSPLFEKYRKLLLEHDYVTINVCKCHFASTPRLQKWPKQFVFGKRLIQRLIRRVLLAMPEPLRSCIRRIAQFTAANCRPTTPV